ncbi:MAG: phage tail tape measure protein [Leclercia adecarboxylata]|nr:phage tail tape measure protein [Leclercia adecarboxylata]MDU1082769.1 phage tail tape measure protein [Leclercia adecarboxylata]
MGDSFQLKAIITGVDKLSPVLAGISKNMKSAGKGVKEKMLVAGAFGTAWSMALLKPVKDAMAFESSMADVRKVVDFDTPEQFRQMSRDILDMSTALPMAANDIAKIVAAGGQAGFAADGLKEFATDAVKMGIAFDQTAEQAGQQMAQWRTALSMTQDDVVVLADKINYLGNTGPASAGQIADVVTTVGSLASVAHVSSGDLAALASTITGVGVQSEVAGTGIQNFMLGLTNASSKRAKATLKAIGMTSKQVSEGMVKDSRSTMLQVLGGIKKLAPERQGKALEWLFGRESIKAIAPLLNNMELLKSNFDKVGDSARYAGSMQKEYASRADTTANQLQLLQNNLSRISVGMGDAMLPSISDGLSQAMPLLNGISDFVRTNPEIVKLAAGAAVGLAAMGGMAMIGVLVAAVGPIGVLLGSLVAAGTFIATNWETIKDAWEHGKPMAPAPLTREQQVVSEAFNFNKTAATPGFGLLAIQQEVANKQIGGDFLRDINVITGRQAPTPFNRGSGPTYNYAAPTGQEMLTGAKSVIQGEMVVRFDNAPAGMRVSEGKTDAPGVKMTPQVGYSQFSSQNLWRRN